MYIYDLIMCYYFF